MARSLASSGHADLVWPGAEGSTLDGRDQEKPYQMEKRLEVVDGYEVKRREGLSDMDRLAE